LDLTNLLAANGTITPGAIGFPLNNHFVARSPPRSLDYAVDHHVCRDGLRPAKFLEKRAAPNASPSRLRFFCLPVFSMIWGDFSTLPHGAAEN